MAAPTLTTPQLESVIRRARRHDARWPVLVHGHAEGLADLELEGQHVKVAGSGSPLEIRALVADTDGPLVVVTECDRDDLGVDLLARVASGRLWSLDRWEAVKDLFGAREVTRDLVKSDYLADALLESRPLNGYPKVLSGVLDKQTALGALLQASLELSADADSLDDLIRWSMRPDAPSRIIKAHPKVRADLEAMIVDRFGPGAQPVVAALVTGSGVDVVPLGLVAGAIHHPDVPSGHEARVRLKMKLGDAEVSSDGWRSLAAATARVVDAAEAAAASGWTERSQVLLNELVGSDLARHSDVIPAGFEQRLQGAADALVAWAARPDDVALSKAADDVINLVDRHHRKDRTRVERMRMAARLMRRGTRPLEWGSKLVDAASVYRSDGAWLDWARLVVSRGESNATLNGVYAQLTERFDTSRDTDNQRFASLASGLAASVPSGMLGIESVMETVVADVARHQPVLLIVLDGMGWTSFIEVLNAVQTQGWVWRTDPAGVATQTVAAVFPTVTEFSRTSLFAGTVRQGDQESEKRAFPAHQSLLAVSKQGKPPVMHHKKELRSGGLDSVPDARDEILDTGRQVVAVVLNNIDERLKDVVAPPAGWGMDELNPMSWLLDAAHQAGRAVILTSDHGHIIDRNAEQISGTSGGERWHLPPIAHPSEVEVSGPRVVPPSGHHSVVLPWKEQLRYATRRNGYHGGITPQEVLIPLAVLTIDDPPEGWTSYPFPAPAWWLHQEPVTTQKLSAEPVPTPSVQAPTLFEEQPEPERSWLDEAVELLSSRRTPRIRLTDAEIRLLLGVLGEHAGVAVSFTKLAALTGLSAARMLGYVSQLRELANQDGSELVAFDSDEVRMNEGWLH